MLSYEHINNQPSRLGEFSYFGEFGASDFAVAVTVISRTAGDITKTLVQGDVDKRGIRADRIKALAHGQQTTLQLQIASDAATRQAQLTAGTLTAKYGGLTKLFVGGGIALAVLMVAGGFAYKMATG